MYVTHFIHVGLASTTLVVRPALHAPRHRPGSPESSPWFLPSSRIISSSKDIWAGVLPHTCTVLRQSCGALHFPLVHVRETLADLSSPASPSALLTCTPDPLEGPSVRPPHIPCLSRSTRSLSPSHTQTRPFSDSRQHTARRVAKHVCRRKYSRRRQ